jgi:predicted DCC family thiol-disulfide oxidoreductase YuxK
VPDKSLIIYDGDCVFCQNYVRFFRLREAIGPLELLDARSGDPRVERFWREGYDLDEGMVFVHGGRVFYGAEAVHVLASLSSRSGLLNRINAAVFRSEGAARLLYPALKLGRRLTLKARGRKLMREGRV